MLSVSGESARGKTAHAARRGERGETPRARARAESGPARAFKRTPQPQTLSGARSRTRPARSRATQTTRVVADARPCVRLVRGGVRARVLRRGHPPPRVDAPRWRRACRCASGAVQPAAPGDCHRGRARARRARAGRRARGHHVEGRRDARRRRLDAHAQRHGFLARVATRSRGAISVDVVATSEVSVSLTLDRAHDAVKLARAAGELSEIASVEARARARARRAARALVPFAGRRARRGGKRGRRARSRRRRRRSSRTPPSSRFVRTRRSRRPRRSRSCTRAARRGHRGADDSRGRVREGDISPS